MNTYKKFAEVYDAMGADRFSIDMAGYVFKIFSRFHINVHQGLDLCCGTGAALRIFHDNGFSMTGLDGSADMLKAAAKKLKGTKIKLYHQQLPGFKIADSKTGKYRQFDFVTCFFDSLNYLTNKRDLKSAYRRVYHHLKPGGWFIFDMNTPESLKTLWGERVFAGTKKDLAWIWENEFQPKKNLAVCHATFFFKKGKLWEKYQENHAETGYGNGEIKKMLRDSGFVIKGFYKCFTFDSPDRLTTRICAVCRRPSK